VTSKRQRGVVEISANDDIMAARTLAGWSCTIART
jgi:hypothetical protein